MPDNWRELGFEHRPIHSDLNYNQARGLEQHYIEKFKTLGNGHPGNAINGLNPNRKDKAAESYRSEAKRKLKSC